MRTRFKVLATLSLLTLGVYARGLTIGGHPTSVDPNAAETADLYSHLVQLQDTTQQYTNLGIDMSDEADAIYTIEVYASNQTATPSISTLWNIQIFVYDNQLWSLIDYLAWGDEYDYQQFQAYSEIVYWVEYEVAQPGIVIQ